MKFIILFLLLLSTLFARFEAQPSQECPAFNNMKHTTNTHHVILDTSKTYTVLKHHKGQNLILVKGEQPAQRWVDDECFSWSRSVFGKNSSIVANLAFVVKFDSCYRQFRFPHRCPTNTRWKHDGSGSHQSVHVRLVPIPQAKAHQFQRKQWKPG